MRAGRAAAKFAMEGPTSPQGSVIDLHAGEDVSYTVPQRARPDNVEKVVEVFFRTRRAFRAARVEVLLGEEVAHSFKRDHMVPAEMERIMLPKATLEKAAQFEMAAHSEKEHGALTIRVRELEETHG